MCKRKTSIVSKFLALLFMFVLIFTSTPVISEAATKASVKPSWSYAGKTVHYLWHTGLPGNHSYGSFSNLKKTDKVIVTSSDKTVAEASYRVGSNGFQTVQVNSKKPGTVKVTCKIKRGKKTYKSTATFCYVKYVNPFKSIKFGNTDYTKNFNKKNSVLIKYGNKQKLSLKMKKDWELVSIYTFDTQKKMSIEHKNNTKISTKNCSVFAIQVRNKKSPEKIMTVSFSKDLSKK